mgnify:CR=1 FL=1
MDETYMFTDEKPGYKPGRYDHSNYIHPTAVIFSGVILGKGNYIGPFCIIGGPAEHRGSWNPKEPGRVVIGNNNTFTGHVTVDGAYLTDGETVISSDCYFMKHAHVGHDAKVGDGVILSVGAVVGGHAIVCCNTNIGCNAFIHQRQVVAPYCMIGAGAVITSKLDTLPLCTYAGNPARLLGPNKPRCAALEVQMQIDIAKAFNLNKEQYKEIANKAI